ncbi:hypothetical protein CRG98_010101, partial [Punica granatum]
VIPNCLDGIFSCPLCLRKGVPHRQTPPSSKYKERVRDKFSGKRELAHRSLPVARAAVLGKARGAGSREDRRVEQSATTTEVDEIHSLIGGMTMLMSLKAVNARCQNQKAVNAGLEPKSSKCRAEAPKAVDAGSKPDAVNAGPKPDAGQSPEHISLWRSEDRGWSTHEGWHDSPVVRGGWPGWTTSGHSTSCHGKVKTASGLPANVGTTRLSYGVGGRAGRPLVIARLAMESVLLGKPLTRDGGSRFRGINSLKSSEDLWGPVRWQSRLDPFPYSEPLTNLAS